MKLLTYISIGLLITTMTPNSHAGENQHKPQPPNPRVEEVFKKDFYGNEITDPEEMDYYYQKDKEEYEEALGHNINQHHGTNTTPNNEQTIPVTPQINQNNQMQVKKTKKKSLERYNPRIHETGKEHQSYILPHSFDFENTTYTRGTSDDSNTIRYAFDGHFDNEYPHLTVVQINPPFLIVHVTFGNNSHTSPTLEYSEEYGNKIGEYKKTGNINGRQVKYGKEMIQVFLSSLNGRQ